MPNRSEGDWGTVFSEPSAGVHGRLVYRYRLGGGEKDIRASASMQEGEDWKSLRVWKRLIINANKQFVERKVLRDPLTDMIIPDCVAKKSQINIVKIPI